MGDWRNFEEGRRGISLANLSDGESISVFIDEMPYLNEEEIDQPDGSTDVSESLRVPCVPVEIPDDFMDMNDDDVDTVDDPHDLPDDAPQYDIINSSATFKRAMREAFPEGVEPVSATVEITAHHPDGSDQYGRSYSVEA